MTELEKKINETANRPFRAEVQRCLTLSSDDIKTMYAKEGYLVHVTWDMGCVSVWTSDSDYKDEEECQYINDIKLSDLIKKYFHVNTCWQYINAEDGDQCFPNEIVAFIED